MREDNTKGVTFSGCKWIACFPNKNRSLLVKSRSGSWFYIKVLSCLSTKFLRDYTCTGIRLSINMKLPESVIIYKHSSL